MAANNSVNNNLYGATNGGNATAGYVGEVISSQVLLASAISLLNSTATTLTSISLTPGDWDVSANILFIPTGTISDIYMGIGPTTNSLPAEGALYSEVNITFGSAASQGISSVDQRINITSTTTMYIVAEIFFSAGACTMCGGIYARRAR